MPFWTEPLFVPPNQLPLKKNSDHEIPLSPYQLVRDKKDEEIAALKKKVRELKYQCKLKDINIQSLLEDKL